MNIANGMGFICKCHTDSTAQQILICATFHSLHPFIKQTMDEENGESEERKNLILQSRSANRLTVNNVRVLFRTALRFYCLAMDDYHATCTVTLSPTHWLKGVRAYNRPCAGDRDLSFAVSRLVCIHFIKWHVWQTIDLHFLCAHWLWMWYLNLYWGNDSLVLFCFLLRCWLVRWWVIKWDHHH